MRRRVLVLGVGNAQVDAIRHFRRRGFEVHAVSYRDEGPGRGLVDRFAVVDLADVDAVLEHARRIEAQLVASIGSDLALPAASRASRALGLPSFVAPETADLMVDKGRLRAFSSSRNVAPLEFRTASRLDELRDWSIFPAVVKPVDSQGQRGVREVHEEAELAEAFERARSFSRSGRIIIERRVEGAEISVNAFLMDGELACCFLTDRFVVESLPGGIVRGHGIPSQVSETVRSKARELVRELGAVLGLENGPLYCQVKCDGGDLTLIEAVPRLDGCHLWRLIALSTGVDLLSASFDLLDGALDPSRLRLADEAAMRQLRLDFSLAEPGQPCPRLPAPEGALFSEAYYEPGERVRPVNGLCEKVGYRIGRAEGGEGPGGSDCMHESMSTGNGG